MTVGLRRSVEISSCRYVLGVAQSHKVTTMLRSTPCGRGGFGFGSSPAAMRSVHSAKSLQRALRVELANVRGHIGAGLPGLDATFPRVRRRIRTCRDLATMCALPCRQAGGRCSNRRSSQCQAIVPGFFSSTGIPLRAGAGKQALVRNFEQRIPIDRRIIFRGSGRARGRCGL